MNHGPNAFPVSYSEEQDFQAGMSLRDYFAAKALDGLLACETLPKDVTMHPESIAKASYEYADAMIAQRGKNP